MNLIQAVSIPVISGLVGWITNVLAVRMLFRPRRPFNLLGWKIQGLVPRRQNDLALSIGRTVEQHLITHEDVRRALGQGDVMAGLDQILRERMGLFVETNMKQIHPMAGMFLTGSTRQKLEGLLLAEVQAMLPELATRMVDSIEDKMDFQKIVEDKVRAFDLDRLERMILDIAGRELRAIELLGAVLGVLIGLIQLGILMI